MRFSSPEAARTSRSPISKEMAIGSCSSGLSRGYDSKIAAVILGRVSGGREWLMGITFTGLTFYQVRNNLS